MKQTISLFTLLLTIWFLLSGHYELFLIVLGFISTWLVTYIAQRMEVIDNEGHPTHISSRILFYWLFLYKEIVKSNIDVIQRILFPSKGISPCLVTLPMNLKTDFGKTILANSITLTPGTVTVDIEANKIEIHALTEDSMTEMLEGSMAAKIRKIE